MLFGSAGGMPSEREKEVRVDSIHVNVEHALLFGFLVGGVSRFPVRRMFSCGSFPTMASLHLNWALSRCCAVPCIRRRWKHKLVAALSTDVQYYACAHVGMGSWMRMMAISLP